MKTSPLTKREHAVLECITRGLGCKASAESLGISVHTVKKHRASAMRKLGLRSSAELVRYAVMQAASGPPGTPGPEPCC